MGNERTKTQGGEQENGNAGEKSGSTGNTDTKQNQQEMLLLRIQDAFRNSLVESKFFDLGKIATMVQVTPSQLVEEMCEDFLNRSKELLSVEEKPTEKSHTDWHDMYRALFMRDLLQSFQINYDMNLGSIRPDFEIIRKTESFCTHHAIYSLLRRITVVEAKNQTAELSVSVLKKCSEYVGGINVLEDTSAALTDEVSAIIIRASFPEKLFQELEQRNVMIQGGDGIYAILNWLYEITLGWVPLYIVVTSRLKGDEYAPYRIVSNNARIEDLRLVIKMQLAETDGYRFDLLHCVIQFCRMHNPKLVELEDLKEGGEMSLAWMDRYLNMYDDIKRERDTQIAVCNKLKKSYDDLQKSKDDLQKSKDDLQKSKDDLQKSNDDLQKSNDDLKKSNDDLKKRLEAAEARATNAESILEWYHIG